MAKKCPDCNTKLDTNFGVTLESLTIFATREENLRPLPPYKHKQWYQVNKTFHLKQVFGIYERISSLNKAKVIKTRFKSSAVDGVYGGDVVEQLKYGTSAGILSRRSELGLRGVLDLAAHGCQKMVLPRATTGQFPLFKSGNQPGKRTLLSPASGKFHSGHGTETRSVSGLEICISVILEESVI